MDKEGCVVNKQEATAPDAAPIPPAVVLVPSPVVWLCVSMPEHSFRGLQVKLWTRGAFAENDRAYWMNVQCLGTVSYPVLGLVALK